MANSTDPDQMASSEANWSGSTLFAKAGQGLIFDISYCDFLQEGPHCAIKEDEFFDAVDASLDKLEKEEEVVRMSSVFDYLFAI